MKERDNETVPNDITQPARPDALPVLVEFVRAHARTIGCKDERTREIGVAVEEALQNIVQFACADGSGEITIACNIHDMGALLIDITDTGIPFNMLVATSFPETADFIGPGPKPSTNKLKKALGNIEYRIDAYNKRNILACVVWK